MLNRIPTYALYGEADRPLVQESLHCESIAQRSQLYDWEIRPHRHELFAQILHIRAGTGQATFDGIPVAMTGPCLVFVPPLSPHGFSFSHDVDGSVVTVVAQQLKARLSASAPELSAHFDSAARRLLVAGSSEAEQVDAVLRALVTEFHGNAPWRSAAIESALTLTLLVVGRALAQSAADAEALSSGSGDASSRSLRHVQRFLSAVDGGYRQQRSIESYAAPLGITATQLNRLCRALLGRSALQAIHARLLLEAERDLAYTSLSVKEIALTLGFSDAAYFTRFFAKQRGRAPTEFRRAAREHLAGN
jgi:AraC family transcriptional activator of pobA